MLLHVGVYDLETKDHTQVFGEAEILYDQIRLNHPGIKLIVSEITPRERYQGWRGKSVQQPAQRVLVMQISL